MTSNTTPTMRDLAIAVINVTPKSMLEPEDRHVPGVYHIEVDASLPEDLQASAALDGFHSSLAIEALDDFRFTVFDPETGKLIEQSDAEGYKNTDHAGSPEYFSDKLPRFYRIFIERLDEEGKAVETASVGVVAGNKKEALELGGTLLGYVKQPKANGTPSLKEAPYYSMRAQVR